MPVPSTLEARSDVPAPSQGTEWEENCGNPISVPEPLQEIRGGHGSHGNFGKTSGKRSFEDSASEEGGLLPVPSPPCFSINLFIIRNSDGQNL